MRSTVLEVLRRGRARIAAGWCQGAFRRVAPDGREHFCAEGALREYHVGVEHSQTNLKSEVYLNAALRTIAPRFACMVWNDRATTTQADVLTLYDRAIELAEAAERLQ